MIRLLVDSTVTLPPEVRQDPRITVVSLYVREGDAEYEDATMDVDAFYERIGSMLDAIPTSSQPAAHLLEDYFEDAARAGDAVLGIFLSSGLSGTYEGALRAARAVAARCPGFQFALIDSASCGGDSWAAVAEALDAMKMHDELDHVVQRALFGIQSSRFIFSPESLAFLKAGGRIGRASALLGGLMHITPVLTVTDGSVRVLAKVRSQKKALARIISEIDADIASRGGLKRMIVHYIGSRQMALDWVRDVVEPHFGRSIEVAPVSPVIGVHVGPALGVCYQCNLPLSEKITGNIQQLVCTH